MIVWMLVKQCPGWLGNILDVRPVKASKRTSCLQAPPSRWDSEGKYPRR